MADQQFPEPTVGIFIFNHKGEVLLLQSHKWPGVYVVPGGHVELGGRLEETAVREAKEETGLEIYDLEFINFQQFIYDPASGNSVISSFSISLQKRTIRM